MTKVTVNIETNTSVYAYPELDVLPRIGETIEIAGKEYIVTKIVHVIPDRITYRSVNIFAKSVKEENGTRNQSY